MRHHFTLIAAAFVLCSLPLWALGQAALTPSSAGGPVYLRLVNASNYVENYQASAVVSERVFGARAQGSDKEYAEFMGYVANTDLSHAKPCLAMLISKHDITEEDAIEVASVYESQLGKRLIDLSRKMTKETIEQGRLVQPSGEGWSADDRRSVAAIYQTSSFVKFHALATKRPFMEGTLACYKSVLSKTHPDVKF